MNKKVAIIMGSGSDADTTTGATKVMQQFDVEYEFCVVPAHRSSERLFEYAKTRTGRNVDIIIAGAGGAAHLPGMMAALTIILVIGVPIKSTNSIDEWDSLLSIVQIPNDVPVATLAVNRAQNAGRLAKATLAKHDESVRQKLTELKNDNVAKVKKHNETLN
ncbi:MAG: 5-(carboxyamino)imidazole ribonucleotide mutase [Taibaiella sp.]|nr:5-(carboxyamino)imidazole ribonucleotide mutase [Taibaiella sp.]